MSFLKFDKTKISKLIVSFLLLAFFTPIFFSLAQVSPTEEKESLEKELQELEEQIAQYEKDITKTAQEKKTLQNQISSLKKKIEQLDLQIRQGNLMIKEISLQITDTEGSIDKTLLKIEDSRQKLVAILREIYQEDQKSLIEILASEEDLSRFFDHLVALETLNLKNQEILDDIKNLKSYLQTQKQFLDEEKDDLERVAKIQALQKQQSEATKKDQEYFLKLTETQYQQYLSEKKELEKRAAEIRARLFDLAGVSQAPTFGEALDVAKFVSEATNIRPSFLLAVLQQESAIGKNVGQCYLTNAKTGTGIRASSGAALSRIMNPNRDVSYFLDITESLGLPWNQTLVSCPMSVGWGGAMGPAQFIPSTWASPNGSPTGVSFKDRVAAITKKIANPWSIKDSFLAAGLYLSDYGAQAKNSDGEWKAAMIYFAGSTKNRAFYWYANQVLEKAKCIQSFIDTETMSDYCQELIRLQ